MLPFRAIGTRADPYSEVEPFKRSCSPRSSAPRSGYTGAREALEHACLLTESEQFVPEGDSDHELFWARRPR